jgi:EAL domain-containing protein (putative c-di-GMP-specific phosphodiesterase class I)
VSVAVSATLAGIAWPGLEITESLVLDPLTKPVIGRLRELGCQFGQGFLFSKPLRVHDAALLLDGSATLASPGR